jgi:hypothetical protein
MSRVRALSSGDPEPVQPPDGSAESASLLPPATPEATHAPFGDLLGSPATAAPPFVPSPPREQATMARVPAGQDVYFTGYGRYQPAHVPSPSLAAPAPRGPAPQDAYFSGSYQQAPAYAASAGKSPSPYSAQPERAESDDACARCLGECCVAICSALCQIICAALCEAALGAATSGGSSSSSSSSSSSYTRHHSHSGGGRHHHHHQHHHGGHGPGRR